MNQLVHIGNQELFTKEFKGRRVITFKDIDLVHERPDGTARRNFSSNKKRFIQDKDYYIVSSDEIRTTRLFPISDNDFTDKALFTESGYLMLVKSFTDDLAWEVQRKLIDGYFRAKEVTTNLSPELQLFKNLFDAMAKQELEVKQANELSEKALSKVDNIKESIIATYDDWREEINSKVRRISNESGIPYQSLFTEMYLKLESKAHCDLKSRIRHKELRLEESGATKATIKNETTKIAIIESDVKLKEIFTQIVKEYAVKYVA